MHGSVLGLAPILNIFAVDTTGSFVDPRIATPVEVDILEIERVNVTGEIAATFLGQRHSSRIKTSVQGGLTLGL